MYLEPCCISHQFPALLRAGQTVYFQTSGDVLFDKMLSAIAYKVEGTKILFLVIPEIDVYALRTIAHYFARDWLQAVVLLTQTAQTNLVRGELSDHLDKVCYGSHRHIMEGMMGILGEQNSLLIQGPMLLEQDPSLCPYSAYYGSDRATLNSVLEAYLPKLHLNAHISGPVASRLLQSRDGVSPVPSPDGSSSRSA